MLHRHKVVFYHLYFIVFVIMIVIFFKKLVDKKMDKVKFDIIPKTNGEYISVPFGCRRFVDHFWFLSSSLDKLVKNLDKDDFKFF